VTFFFVEKEREREREREGAATHVREGRRTCIQSGNSLALAVSAACKRNAPWLSTMPGREGRWKAMSAESADSADSRNRPNTSHCARIACFWGEGGFFKNGFADSLILCCQLLLLWFCDFSDSRVFFLSTLVSEFGKGHDSSLSLSLLSASSSCGLLELTRVASALCLALARAAAVCSQGPSQRSERLASSRHREALGEVAGRPELKSKHRYWTKACF